MTVKSRVRWGVRHGLAQIAIKQGAKRGDPQGRLVLGGRSSTRCARGARS